MNGHKPNTVAELLGWRISTLVFLLAGILIMLATASLLVVGYIASAEANLQAAEKQHRLFQNVLRNRHMLVARDQLTVARWDRSVRNVSHRLDRDFIRDEMFSSLWYDFGHDRVLLVSGADTVLARAHAAQVEFPSAGEPLPAVYADLVERTRQRFLRNRIEIDGGYGQRTVPVSRIDEIAQFGFAEIDGRAAMVSAMPVVPDDGEVALKDGSPDILVSVEFIDQMFTSELNMQLSFEDLAFHPSSATAKALGEDAAYHPLVGDGDPGAFTWTRETPGTRIWAVIIPIILLLATGLTVAALFVARQISRLSDRLETSEMRSRHLAQHDALTGLANRLKFDAALDRAVADLPDRPMAVIGCDLDRFKAVNDTHGHAAGDCVLVAIADRLQAIVGDAGLVGRIGGDEFAILLTEGADVARLRLLTRDVIASICKPIDIGDGLRAQVGISLGVAIGPLDGRSSADLLAAADQSLYAVKGQGRGAAAFACDLSGDMSAKSSDAA